MKKVIIFTVITALLLILALIILCVYNLLFSPTDRPAAKFTASPVTSTLDVNDKMAELLDLDVRLAERISFDTKSSVYVKGLVADSKEAATFNSKLLNDAVRSARSNTKIVVPAGTYYVNSSIMLLNKKKLLISGDIESDNAGVTLINTSYSPFSVDDKSQDNSANFFYIVGCNNIKIENITFDYQSHTSADGIITRIKNGKTYFNVYPEFLSGEKTPLAGGEHITSVLCANERDFGEEKWADGYIKLEKGDNAGEFYIPMEIGKPGNRICCRFFKGEHPSYVIMALNTLGLTLEGLTCNSSPDGFIIAPDGNSDFYFTRLNVSAKQGSQKLLGSNADCMHMNNFSGSLVITDSSFIGIGDDALNIHSKLTCVSDVTENTVHITSKSDYIFPGETVEFFDKNYNSIGFSTVKKVDGEKLTLDRIPDGVKKGFYMQNASLSPDTLVKNCHIEFGRARGLLIQTKNAAITDCTLKNLRLSGILLSPDFKYWYEAGFTENVLIQNNVFENCASLQNGFAVIHASNSHDGPVATALCKLGHKNISIFGNKFISCKGKRITAVSVQNLKND